jgi:serine phosphatase RsbU (regulator of sigma subunit)
MKNIILFVFFIIFCLANSIANSTTNSDSLKTLIKLDKTDTIKVRHLNHLAYSFRNSFPDSTIYYSKKSIEICESIKEKSKLKLWPGYSEAVGNLGIGYRLKGDYPNAKKHYFMALEMDKAMNYKFGIGKRLVGIANYFENISDYSKSLEYGFKALNVNQEINNNRAIALSNSIIGNVYFALENYPLSLKYSLLSYSVFKQIDDKNNIGSSEGKIGAIYTEMKEYNKSFYYLNKGLKTSRDNNLVQGEGEILNYLGNLFIAKRDYTNALKYINLSIELNTKNKIESQIAIAYRLLGQVFLQEKKYSLAEKNLLLALDLDKKSGALNNQFISEKALAEIYEATNKPQEALKHLKQANNLRDSIFNKRNSHKISIMEVEKKDAEAKVVQEKRDLLSQQEIEKQKIVRNSFIGGFILVILIAIGIFRSLQQNRKAKTIIEKQKAEVEHQKQEILDSIEYAKRIQTTILPPPKVVKKYLDDSFILYLPKDIVAGDFYWMETVGDWVLFAACDCTGHGVPGALVSVVCHNALNRAVKEYNKIMPAEILDCVAELVLENFSSDDDVKDGMDASVCALNIATGELYWAGANNPLWLIRHAELDSASVEIIEYKPNKQPIGKFDDRVPYTNHKIEIAKGDTIYLFTDGYADQFGGERGKKLTKAKFKEAILNMQRYNLDEQKKYLLDLHLNYKGNLGQVDDICVIGVRV